MIAVPGSEQMFFRTPLAKVPTDWSRDGKSIVYSVLTPKTSWDIHVVPVSGGEPTTFVVTAADERYGRLSPDGRSLKHACRLGNSAPTVPITLLLNWPAALGK
jgi:hypothetical protein